MAGFRPKYVLADKAHDSNAIRECIAELAASAVIPCTAYASGEGRLVRRPMIFESLII